MDYIEKGDIIQCMNGHDLYEVMYKPSYPSVCMPDMFRPVMEGVKFPEIGSEFIDCPKCGEPFYVIVHGIIEEGETEKPSGLFVNVKGKGLVGAE